MNFTFTQEQLKRCHEHGAKWVYRYVDLSQYEVYLSIKTSFSPLAILVAWATGLLAKEANWVQYLDRRCTHSCCGKIWDKYRTLEENLIDMCCDLWDEQQKKQPANEVVESVKRLYAEVQRLKKEVGI